MFQADLDSASKVRHSASLPDIGKLCFRQIWTLHQKLGPPPPTTGHENLGFGLKVNVRTGLPPALEKWEFFQSRNFLSVRKNEIISCSKSENSYLET